MMLNVIYYQSNWYHIVTERICPFQNPFLVIFDIFFLYDCISPVAHPRHTIVSSVILSLVIQLFIRMLFLFSTKNENTDSAENV